MMTFEAAINNAHLTMRTASKKVMRGKWQGIDVSKKPDFTAYEICHYSMIVRLITESLHEYKRSIRPNLPWADDHFEERVCGQPINPGIEWKNWPWGVNADKFRDKTGLYDHNYQERYWPKFAGATLNETFVAKDYESFANQVPPHHGIRFAYGDLNDVVTELAKDPTTRQAILPVFFPEDTGYQPGRRKPCSLHYHFMLNGNGLDIQYVLRSCDLIRHFRDDIYLTVRLLLWMLKQLRQAEPTYWNGKVPGLFVMHIANLHCFANDMIKLQEMAA